MASIWGPPAAEPADSQRRPKLGPSDDISIEPPIASEPDSPEPPHPSRASLRGLDWFIFFVADVQTGFGPFLAVYLTSQKWTQVEIGVVLSISGITALLCQMPGGALVDAARSERMVAGLALSLISLSALAYATLPVFGVVASAAALHAAASCVLGPAIVAISLGLVGHAALGDRLGRNARFAALGNGIAAAAMGAVGYFFAPRAVFIVTAGLLIPTLFALSKVRPSEVDPERAHGGLPDVPAKKKAPAAFQDLLARRPLLILAGCIMLFHLANGAMLPLMGGVVTMRSTEWATVLIGALIVVPQIIVAIISPWVGHQAQIWGRRTFLLIAFAALAVRAVLFATVKSPYLIVLVQVLDGLTAASLGIMVPLMIADLTRGTGRFNFTQGVIGTAVGIGASISPTIGGYLADHFGSDTAFLGLSAIATLGLFAAWAFMPETRPKTEPAGSG